MSVVVLNMEMPECCLCCPLFAGNGCKATGKIFNDLFNVACRPDGCPLRPMPERHGRLIDADALEYRADNVRDPMGRTEKTVMWKKIESAPTIIEAEGGSDE